MDSTDNKPPSPAPAPAPTPAPTPALGWSDTEPSGLELVKRCVVQLGIHDPASASLADAGSGALLPGGRILSAAHVFFQLLPGRTVLVAVYAGSDGAPARWAYEAELLTPPALLHKQHEGVLLDLAVLRITGSVACTPDRSHGKAHVGPGVPQHVPLRVAQRSAAPAADQLPFLQCVPREHEHRLDAEIIAAGYAAAAGKHMFLHRDRIVTLEDGCLQTAAFIHSGSSGGPVVDAAGRIVAVISHGGALAELARARLTSFLTPAHFGPPAPVAGADSALGGVFATEGHAPPEADPVVPEAMIEQLKNEIHDAVQEQLHDKHEASVGAALSSSGDKASADRALHDGLSHLRAALPGARSEADDSKREAEMQGAFQNLRQVVEGRVGAGQAQDIARRCLALALFVSACERMRAQDPNAVTCEQLREAVQLAPGLGDKRRNEARRYLAYATYAMGKDKLQNRDFAEACACFERVLDHEGGLRRWLDPEKLGVAKLYLEQCETSIGINAISIVQEWLEAHKLQRLAPALEELGAEAGDGVAILMKLGPDDVDSLRSGLPKLKRHEFDSALADLKHFYDPELKQSYIVPATFVMSGATKSLVCSASSSLAQRSTTLQATREPPPEHAIGSQIDVWRHADDVVACEVKSELGRGAQAIVYRVESAGAVRALKVARVLAIADEARVMLRINSPQKHPHVLEVSYVCSPAECDDELIFLEQLIEGETLAQLIRSGRLYDGEHEAVSRRLQRMCVQLLSALAHVHARGVLHQDVKPDNIMVDPRIWDLCLIDFGIAAIDETCEGGRVTVELKGGTPSHCSPIHRNLLLYAGDASDPAERRRRVREQPLTQCVDLWGAAATCLDAFGGGGSWRRGKPSCDAWQGKTPAVNGIDSGAWRVPVPTALAAALDLCLAGGDATARQVLALVAGAAVAPAPVPGLAQQLACAMYANIGLALHNRSRAAGAEMCLRDAVEAAGRRDARALNNLGVVLSGNGDREEAEKCFREALALDADHQQANLNLARVDDDSWEPLMDRRGGAAVAFDTRGDSGGGIDIDGSCSVLPLRFAAGQCLELWLPEVPDSRGPRQCVVLVDATSEGEHRVRVGGCAEGEDESKSDAEATSALGTLTLDEHALATRTWRALPASGRKQAEVVPRYCAGQRFRVWHSGAWSDAGAGGGVPSLAGVLHPAHQVPALLVPETLAAEHVRFARELQSKFACFLDAFSGQELDLKTQTTTVQYQEGAYRDDILRGTIPTDYDDVHHDALLRRRGGTSVGELPTGGRDASELLKKVLAPAEGWEAGVEFDQQSVLILGAAASGKTTLLRRFVVETLEYSGPGAGNTGFVPLFVTVIELAQLLKAARAAGRAVLDECTSNWAGGSATRARYLAQALSERRAVFLVDGLDEAGDARPEVEAFVSCELMARGHRVLATSRRSGFSTDLRAQFNSAHSRFVVQVLPLSVEQQRQMVASRLVTDDVRAFTEAARDPRYAELVENPLMLTMMISVFDEMGGKLPEQRSELYGRALAAMLGRADAVRKAAGGRAQLEDTLRRVALASHRREGGEFRIFASAQARSWTAAELGSVQEEAPPGDLVGRRIFVVGMGEATVLGTRAGCLCLSPTKQHIIKLAGGNSRAVLLQRHRNGGKAFSVLPSQGNSSAWGGAVSCVEAGTLPIIVPLDGAPVHDPAKEVKFSHLTFQEFYVAQELVARWRACVQAGGMADSAMLLCSLLRQQMAGGDIEAFSAALLHVDLSSTQLRAAEAVVIAACMQQNCLLTTLNLERNDIGAEGCKTIAEVLPKCPLTTLNLEYNEIGDEFGKAIAEVLPKCPLTTLNLGSNSLGVEGGKAIAEVLPRCSSLTELNLRSNEIGDEGPETLDLSDNIIGEKGGKVIAEVLSSSPLSDLNLRSNKIGAESEKAIAENPTPIKMQVDKPLSGRRAIYYTGDVIYLSTLHGDGKHSGYGFMCADGFDSQGVIGLHTCKRAGTDLAPAPELHEHFRDCLFRIVYRQVFGARTAFKFLEEEYLERQRSSAAAAKQPAAVDKVRQDHEEEALKTLRQELEDVRQRKAREAQRNDENRLETQTLKYAADIVQLQHVVSGKWLCANIETWRRAKARRAASGSSWRAAKRTKSAI
eukprot:g3080.t1